ncbi:hypothetical protein ABLG96_15720 [Nakamurella sp. A5-74]|uniref:Serine hydrolase n=1 Tax=Nakamurella sp. A5-74 TaxID=3158264 RepID=A0AAU8DL09_9ACTN
MSSGRQSLVRLTARTVLPLVAALMLAAAGSQVATAAPAPAAAAAEMTPQAAVDLGAAQAQKAQGVRTYASVIDLETGQVIAQTDNADEQVASESVVKILLAAHYLVKYDGKLPVDVDADLAEMIKYSDDDICSAYWDADGVTAIARRYFLKNTEVNPDDPGRWGATRITAHDMSSFLYQASLDPVVGPWLVKAMQSTADVGLDFFDQNFGFNSLDGAASKQGWGSDNFSDQANAVHSVGITDRYAAAILQTGPSGTYRTMGALATNTVELLMSADRPAVPVATAGAAPPLPTSPTGTVSLAAGVKLWLTAITF